MQAFVTVTLPFPEAQALEEEIVDEILKHHGIVDINTIDNVDGNIIQTIVCYFNDDFARVRFVKLRNKYAENKVKFKNGQSKNH